MIIKKYKKIIERKRRGNRNRMQTPPDFDMNAAADESKQMASLINTPSQDADDAASSQNTDDTEKRREKMPDRDTENSKGENTIKNMFIIYVFMKILAVVKNSAVQLFFMTVIIILLMQRGNGNINIISNRLENTKTAKSEESTVTDNKNKEPENSQTKKEEDKKTAESGKNTPGNVYVFKKNMIAEKDMNLKTVFFSYFIQGYYGDETEKDGKKIYSGKNRDVVKGSPYIGSAVVYEDDYKKADAIDDKKLSVTRNVYINFSNVTYYEEGIYRYRIVEMMNGSKLRSDLGSRLYILDVYVTENNGEYVIDSYDMHDGDIKYTFAKDIFKQELNPDPEFSTNIGRLLEKKKNKDNMLGKESDNLFHFDVKLIFEKKEDLKNNEFIAFALYYYPDEMTKEDGIEIKSPSYSEKKPHITIGTTIFSQDDIKKAKKNNDGNYCISKKAYVCFHGSFSEEGVFRYRVLPVGYRGNAPEIILDVYVEKEGDKYVVKACVMPEGNVWIFPYYHADRRTTRQ